MSSAKSIVDVQLEHLLQMVTQHREKRCAKIQQLAEQKATLLISKAHQAARHRMHEANITLRENMDLQLHSTAARLQTKKRLARQRADEQLLESGWLLVEKSLQRAWQQKEQRIRWVDNLTSLAISRLTSPHWIIEYPVDWASEEQKSLLQRLQKELGQPPQMQADSSITAGLRFCADGSCVDGTAEGLMHEKSSVESTFLTVIHKQREAGHG